jgi:nitrous oxide reductase
MYHIIGGTHHDSCKSVKIYQQIITKKQAENESVEELNIELMQNLKYANANLQTPQDWYEFTLKNALIAQIRSDKTRKKLLAIQDKNYPEVLNVAKVEKLVKMKNRQIVSTCTQSQVYATSTFKSQSRGQQNQPHQGQQGNHCGRSQ